MPPRRKTRTKKNAPVGPFDLSKRLLPGSSELDALTTGYSLERERGIGYGMAARLANQNILSDATSQQPWIVADAKTGLLRSHNAPQLFDVYPTEMREIFTEEGGRSNITSGEFARGHAWRRAHDLDANKPLTGPLADLGKHYVRLRTDVFLHHRLQHYPTAPAGTTPQKLKLG